VKVILLCRSCIRRDVRKWHSSDAVIIRREGRITGLEQTHLQLTPTAAPAPEEIKSPPRWAPQLNVGAYQSSDRVRPRTGTTDRWALGNQMPSSCGQPIILSVIVRHHNGPGSGRVDEREHSFCYTGIMAGIGPFGEPSPKILWPRHAPPVRCRRELGCRPIVRAVERDGS